MGVTIQTKPLRRTFTWSYLYFRILQNEVWDFSILNFDFRHSWEYMQGLGKLTTEDHFITGESGKPGTNKPFPGPPGPKGDQGAVGRTGAQGSQGAKGEKGQDGAGQSGVKYVRWGRTTCPSGAQIVYKGK